MCHEWMQIIFVDFTHVIDEFMLRDLRRRGVTLILNYDFLHVFLFSYIPFLIINKVLCCAPVALNHHFPAPKLEIN